MLQRLAPHTLSLIGNPQVRRPAAGRPGGPSGVLHLGLGAFHRAHQAMVFDALLESGDGRWSVMGVAMRSPTVVEALQSQGGLYSVQINGAGGRHWQVVASITESCVAAHEPERVIAAIAASATRWITITVTEKGYGPALGELLAAGLARRATASLGGLTIASCDNLSGNGDLTRRLCLEATTTPELRRWIDGRCAFPNSMVDRIVPAATDRRRDEAHVALGVTDEAALATESFWEWILQDRLVDPTDADALRAVGVAVVDDVSTYEEAKLRLLNGSHSALACIGVVAGLPTVDACVSRPAIRRFLHGLMTEELMPRLARPGLPAYRDALLERFANPALAHSVHQIATDASRKIPQRWVPAVLAQRHVGGAVEHLAFAAAAWIRSCTGVDEAGRGYAIADPEAATLQRLASETAGSAEAAVAALLGIGSIWGPVLATDAAWHGRVARWLGVIRQGGVEAALAELDAG